MRFKKKKSDAVKKGQKKGRTAKLLIFFKIFNGNSLHLRAFLDKNQESSVIY